MDYGVMNIQLIPEAKTRRLQEYQVDSSLRQVILTKEDITFLLENTDLDEYDIREWFREFLKVFYQETKISIFLVFRTVLKECLPRRR